MVIATGKRLLTLVGCEPLSFCFPFDDYTIPRFKSFVNTIFGILYHFSLLIYLNISPG